MYYKPAEVLMRLLIRMFKTVSFLAKNVGRFTKFQHFSTNKGVLLAAYSSEDRGYILKKINERDLPSKAIGESHTNKIIQYVERNKIGTLEDLLKVNGIGPKLLKKICDKILDAKNPVAASPIVKKRKDYQFVIPALSETKKKALINVVAVHIGHEKVSWALVDSVTKEVLEWDFTDNSCESENLFITLQKVARIEALIPEGDIYLLEENGFGRQRADLCKSHLNAMFLTSFQLLRGKSIDDPVVALVKSGLKNRLYNASVGSERVSIQGHVEDMIQGRCAIDSAAIPEPMAEWFLDLKPHVREDLAQALLLATSFIKIILGRQPQESLKPPDDQGDPKPNEHRLNITRHDNEIEIHEVKA